MSTWKEKLQNIKALRHHSRESYETLYASKIDLLKIDNSLIKIKQQQTIVPASLNEIKELRLKLTGMEAGLQELNRSISTIDSLSAKKKKNAELISFLDKKIQLTSAQIKEVNKQITQQINNQQPDGRKIHELQKQLEQPQQLLEELQLHIAKEKNEHSTLQRQEASNEARKVQLTQQRKSIQNEIDSLQEQLNNKLKPTHLSPEEAEQKKGEIILRKKQAKTNAGLAASNLHDAISSIYVDPHPRAVISNLNDNIPFLLMPIRLETRFITENGATQLWLRVYPDDISIHIHEKLLTDKEIAEGEKYWKAIFEAEKNAGAEKEDEKKKTWSYIASLFGSQRAAWIVCTTKPVNWSVDLSGIENAGHLIYPVHDLTKTDSWSRAPRTKVMPDKFVVTLYERSIVHEIVGNLIPDELFVGPDPMEAEESFIQSADHTLVFGESYNWTSDFDKAVQNGMGFKIPLTPAQTLNGFDRIVVLGAYLSADETESKSIVEDLIDNHHYSPNGFSIVKQGTATNNTEEDGSGFSKNDPFNNISYFVETGKPLFDAESDCDGKNLANALGIDDEHLQYVVNSDATDLKEAVAMNNLLYPSTLGYYFDTMLKPVLDQQSQDKLRDFFIQHVTGRGPLPAIRVGNQPYGILLTSDFSNWKWERNEPVWGIGFLNTLYNVLKHYQTLWNQLQSKLMYVGKPGVDPAEVLMDILGLQPGSVSFFQRTGFTVDDLRNQAFFKYGDSYSKQIESASAISRNEVLNFLEGLGYNIRGVEGNLKAPQLLQLIFQHYHTSLDEANLIDDIPLSENDPIRFYNELAEKNYLNWLDEINSVAGIEKHDFGVGIKAPNSLLYLQSRRSLLLELSKASVKWFGNRNVIVDHALDPVNFHNIRSKTDITKWEVMKAELKHAEPDHLYKNKAVAEHLLTTGKNENEAVFLNEMKKALKFLSDKPTARLERCFTEHLDTCSYRLDSWQSGLFNERLVKQRKIRGNDHGQERQKGIYLGAYGWLENVKPGNRRKVTQESISESLKPANGKSLYEYADNGGFVHAPSVNHATAAAVLRSGYLSHASREHPDTMAVNLSSERVRRALFILEGIRNGQTLEALLGYQFERGLHDRGSADSSLRKLNAYIYDFRKYFTIIKHQVLQEGIGESTPAIPSNNVVNGVNLALSTKDFPYGATGAVASASIKEKEAISDEKDKLSDSLDAVKDLLLSESVFQMVQGNFDRTGAVMNAMKDMHIPPELDVINTPRSSHFSFTNRVTVQFKTLSAADEEYNPWHSVNMTPCAVMESGINRWLKKLIGDPAQLACMVSHIDSNGVEDKEEVTIDKLNVQPIDLVYISGNELNTGAKQQNNEEDKTAASELESRIAFYYRKLKLLDDDIPVTIQFMEPVDADGKKPLGKTLSLLRTLKSMITDSRSLDAQDFDSPSRQSMADKTNPKGYLADELLTRVQEALAGFTECLTLIKMLPVTKKTESGITETSLGSLFNELDSDGKNFEDIDIVFAANDSLTLQDTLIRIANFRLPDSFPHAVNIFNDEKKIRLLNQARKIARQMATIIASAGELLSDAISLPGIDNSKKVTKLAEAGRLIFGDVLNILPLFTYNNPADIQLSNSHRDQLFKHAKEQLKMNFVAEEWMQQVSHVRPRIAKWDHIHTLHELLNNDQLVLKPIQLPYRANDSWLAVEFPSKNEDDTDFNITDDTLSIIIQGEPSSFTAGAQSGLLIDEWTELIPDKEEITGITFNYNQPNAMPPQALLLAVPSEEKGAWSWDDLVGILNDTIVRAKSRAIEPAILNKSDKPEAGVLLPAVLANFSTYDLDLALDFRTNVAQFAEQTPVIPVNN